MIITYTRELGTSRRRRFAGAERCLRVLQFVLDIFCERVLATEHAPRGSFRFLERPHGLAEIVERGRAVVFVKRLGVNFPRIALRG